MSCCTAGKRRCGVTNGDGRGLAVHPARAGRCRREPGQRVAGGGGLCGGRGRNQRRVVYFSGSCRCKDARFPHGDGEADAAAKNAAPAGVGAAAPHRQGRSRCRRRRVDRRFLVAVSGCRSRSSSPAGDDPSCQSGRPYSGRLPLRLPRPNARAAQPQHGTGAARGGRLGLPRGDRVRCQIHGGRSRQLRRRARVFTE
jgi:hypothetical protein